MARANLAQHDGLALSGNSSRIAHPATLCEWIEAGYLTLDLEFSCFRVTEKARAALSKMADR